MIKDSFYLKFKIVKYYLGECFITAIKHFTTSTEGLLHSKIQTDNACRKLYAFIKIYT